MLYLPAVTPGTTSGRSAFKSPERPVSAILRCPRNSGNRHTVPGDLPGTDLPEWQVPAEGSRSAVGASFRIRLGRNGKNRTWYGAGIYYDRIQGNRTFDSVTNPPEAVSPTLNQNLVSSSSSNVLLGPPNLVAVDPTGKVPSNYNYQISVQYRLPQAMTLRALTQHNREGLDAWTTYLPNEGHGEETDGTFSVPQKKTVPSVPVFWTARRFPIRGRARRAVLNCNCRFRGRLAQLGERCVRNAEVGGSIPPPSTKFLKPA
jgi:hypothetical protein